MWVQVQLKMLGNPGKIKLKDGKYIGITLNQEYDLKCSKKHE